MRKSRKMMLSERLELFNIFTDSIFSRLTNNSTNFMPKRRTNRKMMTLAVVMAKSQISVPRITPKAYPAPISKGCHRNYRKEYLQDVHSNKTKDSPYSFVIDPHTELFGIRYKMNQGTPDKISDQDYKNNGNDSQYPFDLFVFFSRCDYPSRTPPILSSF